MNQAEITHFKAVARHIAQHASTLSVRMETIQYASLDMQSEYLERLIKEFAEEGIKEIEQVLADMLPKQEERSHAL